MPPNHSHKNAGYTRRELVVTLTFVFFMTVFVWLGTRPVSRINTGVRANATAKNGKAIYNWLQACANDNNGKFPEARQFSNEAYHQLFIKKYIDDEQDFGIANDPWLNNAPGGNKKADNEIGTEPDFAQALAPGECSWAYVTGLDVKSPSTLPLMGNAFSDSIGIYEKDPKKRGGVFKGEKAVWVSVGGTAKVADLKDDLMVKEWKDGRQVNIYGAEWGTKPEDVKNPAG